MLAARAQTGKPVRAQLSELAALRRWRIGGREYYEYRLFDDTRFTPEQKREYTGRRFQWTVYLAVNDPGLVADSGIKGSWGGKVDKVLFDCLMGAAGVPRPRILAVFDPAGSSHEGSVSLRTVDELERFIRTNGGRGFFAKPARASSGVGACAVVRIEGEDALLADGRRLAVGVVAQQIAAHSRAVVQERLSPHPTLENAIGHTIATLRVVVLRRRESSDIHRVVLRIPVGDAMVDNFAGGTTGNLLGRVEPATGRVECVYSGTGVDQRRVDRHPDTGATLAGLLLPDWPDALRVVERASLVLSGMPLQSWDLALTDRGPLMIEVNDVSSQDVLQLCGPPGLLDRALCDFLRERGFRWTYPHPVSR